MRVSCAAVLGLVLAAAPVSAADLKTLVAFNGTNGSSPFSNLIVDASGNLFGTTFSGGVSNNGTVFRINAGTNSLTTLASFNGGNGSLPTGLTRDATGNLYGTTYAGGIYNLGTVFRLSGSGALTTVVSFTSSTGKNPYSGVVLDGSGNLFGSTNSGGPGNGGTVFKIAAGTGVVTTLASFDTSTGFDLRGPLVRDAGGNLYGTTSQGGAGQGGTVFKIAAGTTIVTTLASFNGGNGSKPYSGLTMDANGNLFGTTLLGGTSNDGTVFEIAAGTDTLTTLINFDGSNGIAPSGGLAVDAAGNVFGTTSLGLSDYGTVFKIAAGTHELTTLATFDGTNGANAYGLTADASGNLFGTTRSRGPGNNGTVFEITNAGFVTGLPEAAVPEPASWATMIGGLGMIGGAIRKRRGATASLA